MVEATGRYPSATAEAAWERKLAAWRRRQHRDANAGILAIHDGLALLPGWRSRPSDIEREALWQDRLAAGLPPRKPLPREPRHIPTRKETTMIKRHSDVVLEITAHDPNTIQNDLNAAVEIARDHAMKESRHGILVTQHGYTSYTVAVSGEVPYGQTHERREEPANSQIETGPGR